VLEVPQRLVTEMFAHAIAGLPDEACGLVAGPVGGTRLDVFYPCGNTAASSTLYNVDAGDHLRADRDADERGMEIVGVVHSHTHTEAYPSATDVEQAPDPSWHYLLVSLREPTPSLRSYRIAEGQITETAVSVTD